MRRAVAGRAWVGLACVLGGAAVYVTVQVALLAVSARRGRCRARSSAPFERVLPTSAPARAHVLVLGDSTGVGVGVDDPRASLAGLLARDFPGSTLENRSIAGARLLDTLHQVLVPRAGFPVRARHDLVMVHAGGNDVLRVGSMRDALSDADTLCAALCDRADHVVWFGSANIGLSPLFLPPFGRWMTARMRRANGAFRRIAGRHGVVFFDYFREAARDPYSRKPERYYAANGVHPSRAAYRYCYRQMRRALPLERWLHEPSQRAARPANDAPTGSRTSQGAPVSR